MAKNNKLTIDVSTMTFIKIVVIGLLLAFLFYIRDILMIVFIALILSSAINPWVDWFQAKRIPRFLAILFIYAVAFGAIFFSAYLIVGPLSIELKNFSADFPGYWNQLSAGWQKFSIFSQQHGLENNINDAITSIEASLTATAGNFFGGIVAFLGGIFSTIIILIITYYLSLYDQRMKRRLRMLFPAKYQPYFTHLVARMQDKIGLWLRGQLVLGLIIFLMALIGLSLLGVKYVWVLALLSGISEIIPYFGPIIGGGPAVFIAFTQSPALGLATLVLFFFIHQSENYLIVPKVMQKAVGLNPVIIIVAMLIGAQVAGIFGIILAVPVATALNILISDILDHRKKGFNVSGVLEE